MTCVGIQVTKRQKQGEFEELSCYSVPIYSCSEIAFRYLRSNLLYKVLTVVSLNTRLTA